MVNIATRKLATEFKEELKDCIQGEAIRLKSNINYSKLNLPEYVNEKNYINICGLYRLAMRQKSCLENDTIEKLLRLNKHTFKFLNNVIDCVPNAIEELKEHGVMYIVNAYNNHKVISAELEQSIKNGEKQY